VPRAGLVGAPIALLLAGCSVLAPPDPRLCSAAQNLSAAIALTTTAIRADESGEVARAQGLATHARSLTELANGTLHQVPQEQQAAPAWQSLFGAYGLTAEAANSLLPAYADSHGMGPQLLSAAGTSIDKARTGLPAMCFDLPADLETPASS
jgi:cellulase/cellobiase CelA1